MLQTQTEKNIITKISHHKKNEVKKSLIQFENMHHKLYQSCRTPRKL